MQTAKLRANWADPSTTAENERLPRWLKWVWAGRGTAFSVNFLLMAQITYYCTDLLGMPAATVGILLLVSKVFDAFTDVMAGYISDPAATAQPESAISMIHFMFAIFPVIVAVITLAAGYLYAKSKSKVLDA